VSSTAAISHHAAGDRSAWPAPALLARDPDDDLPRRHPDARSSDPHAPARATRRPLLPRLSSEEQVEGYSLDAQQRAGLAHCAAHGWAVAGEYRDEGRSARTDDIAKRPAFRQLIEDAEAGLLDVVVVHKPDRFARNLRVTLETLERLDRAGVGFVSISESMDFTTPIGKVILATLAAFAQYYSDNTTPTT
jgi:DNA invertase Pin-like site-specific DNA recombinase